MAERGSIMKRFILLFALMSLGAMRISPASGPADLQEFSFQAFFYWGVAAQRGKDDEVVQFEIHNPELYYQEGEKFHLLSLSRNQLGLPHSFRGPRPFRLYRKEITEDGEKMIPVAALAESGIKNGEHQILLVKQTGDKFELRAVGAALERVGAGSLLLLNSTPYRVSVGSEGGAGKIVPAGGSDVVPIRPDGDHSFRLRIAAEEKGGWRLVRSVDLSQVTKNPLFVVVYPDPRREGKWHTSFLRLRQQAAKPEAD
jgi:hypothetical protein